MECETLLPILANENDGDVLKTLRRLARARTPLQPPAWELLAQAAAERHDPALRAAALATLATLGAPGGAIEDRHLRTLAYAALLTIGCVPALADALERCGECLPEPWIVMLKGYIADMAALAASNDFAGWEGHEPRLFLTDALERGLARGRLDHERARRHRAIPEATAGLLDLLSRGGTISLATGERLEGDPEQGQIWVWGDEDTTAIGSWTLDADGLAQTLLALRERVEGDPQA